MFTHFMEDPDPLLVVDDIAPPLASSVPDNTPFCNVLLGVFQTVSDQIHFDYQCVNVFNPKWCSI